MIKVKWNIDDGICETDEFLSLDKDAQLLFFHYVAHADDDGVVINPLAIARMVQVDEEMIDCLEKDGLIEEHVECP